MVSEMFNYKCLKLTFYSFKKNNFLAKNIAYLDTFFDTPTNAGRKSLSSILNPS
jgi:hypothetical protein